MIQADQIAIIESATREVADIEATWAVCGGWAIDLYLDKVTRPHKDVDIAIRRRDQLLFQKHLIERGWTLEIADNGRLDPWPAGEYVELPANTIWCRRGEEFLELLFDEWDDDLFRYRKKQSITLPADRAMVETSSGYPVLAPEIVLLYKSNDPDNMDYQSDFEQAYPQLSADRRRWLQAAIKDLHGEHPWLSRERHEGPSAIAVPLG